MPDKIIIQPNIEKLVLLSHLISTLFQLNKIIIQMSKEEIERILNSDFSLIDNTIDAKINSIDQITGKLTEKSNFLAQFQLLLQNQLGSINTTKTAIKAIPAADSQFQVQTKTQPIKHQKDSISPIFQKDPLFQICQHNYPEIKQESAFKKRSIDFEVLHSVKKQVDDLKLLFNFVKEQIKGQIQIIKLSTKETIQNLITSLQAQQDSKYKSIIKELQIEIAFLRQKNKVLTEQQLNPLKELTFQKSNDKIETFNVTKRFREYQEHSNFYSSPVPRNNQPILNSYQWKTYQFKFDQPRQNQSIIKDILPSSHQPYSIPDLKNISVGVPPIKNGFGVLKSANQVIYRGMWKEGKFNGSGKLNWDGYCYEGNFQNGSFQGHGRLQIKNMIYVGKFKENKLWGEGTLQMGGKRVVGVWQRNKMIRMF